MKNRISLMRFLTLSWDAIYNICLELAEKIIDDNYKIDAIIGVSRGGLVPSRILADILNIYDIFIVTARYYKDIDKRLRKPIININTDIEELRGKNLLIVDDITDTGNTLLTLITMLKDCSIRTLTLYKKPKSMFKPDYYSEITDKWIVFPWDICETLRTIIKHKEDLSIIEINNIVKRLLLIIKGEINTV